MENNSNTESEKMIKEKSSDVINNSQLNLKIIK